MISAAQVQVENRTGLIQRAFVQGNIYKLVPYEIRPFSPDVASAFFSQCGHAVHKHVGATVPTPAPWEPVAWIANMTGNPFLPDEVSQRRVQKGEEVEISVKNPLKEPVVIRRSYGGGQATVPKQDGSPGTEVLNLSKTVLIIPPYTRVAIAENLANWMLRRDMQQRMHHVGKLIRARPQQPFEPNESWDVYKLRFYAVHVLGIEEHLLGKHPAQITDEIEEADVRAHLLRTMFFLVVDPRVNIPDEAMFNMVYTPEKLKEPAVEEKPADEEEAKKAAIREKIKAANGK